MHVKYDKIYAADDVALGDPFPEVLAFFASMPKGQYVLDVGCGQGRDAIPVAKMGFEVLGIDPSSVGIEQLNRTATVQGLGIEAIVATIDNFATIETFDIILCDRTLHMLPDSAFNPSLQKLVGLLNPGGRMLIIDEKRNIPMFKTALEEITNIKTIEQLSKTSLHIQTNDIGA